MRISVEIHPESFYRIAEWHLRQRREAKPEVSGHGKYAPDDGTGPRRTSAGPKRHRRYEGPRSFPGAGAGSADGKRTASLQHPGGFPDTDLRHRQGPPDHLLEQGAAGADGNSGERGDRHVSTVEGLLQRGAAQPGGRARRPDDSGYPPLVQRKMPQVETH